MSRLSTDSDATTLGPLQQIRRLGLEGVPGPVGRARDFVSGVLNEWDEWERAGSDSTDAEAGERAGDILLVVSELVGNAVVHGGGVQELAVTVEGRALTVGVTDREPAVPTAMPPRDPARPGGRGLHVVGLLSQEWGATRHASGKTVWAVFGC